MKSNSFIETLEKLSSFEKRKLEKLFLDDGYILVSAVFGEQSNSLQIGKGKNATFSLACSQF